MPRKNRLLVGEENQKRVDALTDSPITLTDHRAICDTLLEKMVANGNASTSIALLNVAQKLAVADHALRLRQGSTWTQERVIEFMQHVADTLSQEAELLPISADERADFLSAISSKIDTFFRTSKNSAEAIRLIEHAKE